MVFDVLDEEGRGDLDGEHVTIDSEGPKGLKPLGEIRRSDVFFDILQAIVPYCLRRRGRLHLVEFAYKDRLKKWNKGGWGR